MNMSHDQAQTILGSSLQVIKSHLHIQTVVCLELLNTEGPTDIC
jgi:hypothetical protein